MNAGFENGRKVPVTQPAELAHEPSTGDGELPAGPDDLELRFDFSEAEEAEIEAEVERRVKAKLSSAQGQAIKGVLFLVKDAEFPRRAVYQLLYMCGAGSACGGSSSKMAKEFGISKQAFEQEAERLFGTLDLRKNPLEKSATAAARYAETNFRRRKKA